MSLTVEPSEVTGIFIKEEQISDDENTSDAIFHYNNGIKEEDFDPADIEKEDFELADIKKEDFGSTAIKNKNVIRDNNIIIKKGNLNIKEKNSVNFPRSCVKKTESESCVSASEDNNMNKTAFKEVRKRFKGSDGDPRYLCEVQVGGGNGTGKTAENHLAVSLVKKQEERFVEDILLFCAEKNKINNKLAALPPHEVQVNETTRMKMPVSQRQYSNSSEFEFCYVCVDDIVEGCSFKEHFDQKHQHSCLCYICNAPSPSFTSFLNHLNTHTLSCDECNESFTSQKDSLLHHKLIHNSVVPYKKKNSCNTERSRQRGKKSVLEVIVKTENENDNLTSVCEPDGHASVTDHTCVVCGKEFRTRQHLRRHEFTHRVKPIICKQCCLSFDTLDELKEHRIQTHSRNFQHICEVCGLSYEKFFSYRDHMKKIHFGVKSVYQCELCHKILSNGVIYQTHMRTHSGEKPFVCSICGKSYHDKYSMVKHEKLHLTQQVYKCPLCTKSYSRSCMLSEHIKWNHATTAEVELSNYKCSVCHEELGNADCYLQHVYNHCCQEVTS